MCNFQARVKTKFSPILPEKPLKTVLIHQNDHHRPKKRSVAFLELHCDHFKGLRGTVLRGAVFQGGGGRVT